MAHAAPPTRTLRTQLEAAAASCGRVFVVGAGTAYLALGTNPLDLGWANWKVVVSAGLGSVALTAVNWARKGDPRFGR